jgi:hypothetical protein
VTKDKLTQSSSSVTSFFLRHDNLGVGERGFGQVVTQLHQPTGPIYKHAIGTFNVFSWGLTHRSLIEIGGGYNLEDVNFPHHTSRLSKPMVSSFHLRAPPGLKLTKLNIDITPPSRRVASMPLDLYRTLQLRLANANDLQLLKGVVKDNLEGITKIQLWCHITPIT